MRYSSLGQTKLGVSPNPEAGPRGRSPDSSEGRALHSRSPAHQPGELGNVPRKRPPRTPHRDVQFQGRGTAAASRGAASAREGCPDHIEIGRWCYVEVLQVERRVAEAAAEVTRARNVHPIIDWTKRGKAVPVKGRQGTKARAGNLARVLTPRGKARSERPDRNVIMRIPTG